ncbi:MAG: hypothetical protein N3F65_02625 [Nitrososphaeria archaeon]|nr:hypothetical protein [Nitrososphaeria archaeon]
MRIKLRFIPKAVADYFGLKEISSLELRDDAKYRDLVNVLEKKFEEASGILGDSDVKAFPESFIILSNGESVMVKLNEPVKPEEEISVIVMAMGG